MVGPRTRRESVLGPGQFRTCWAGRPLLNWTPSVARGATTSWLVKPVRHCDPQLPAVGWRLRRNDGRPDECTYHPEPVWRDFSFPSPRPPTTTLCESRVRELVAAMN